MTPTEKQKLIAEQAIYEDLMGYDLKDTYYSKNPSTIVGFQGQLVYIGCDVNKVDSIKPILRPLDLTKEITHRGYNENQPFIPLVELAKMSMRDAIKKEYYKQEQFVLEGNEVVLCDYVFSYEKRECFSWYHLLEPFRENTCLYQQSIYDLLNLWHFDTRNLIEKSEAISTDEVNPYEV